MPYFYQSGEEILAGDRVLYFGESGEIEFVADRGGDRGNWYVEEFGGGVMVVEPKAFGHVFLADPQTDEHLELVSRRIRPE